MPVAHATSNHLKVLRYAIDEAPDHLFLTLFCDTDVIWRNRVNGQNIVTNLISGTQRFYRLSQ